MQSNNRYLGGNLAIVSAALLGTALSPLAALAQDATWNGPGTRYEDSGNWTPAGVPANRATFTNAGPTTVELRLNASINQLLFAIDAPAFTLTNTGTFTINGIGGIGILNESSQLVNVRNYGTIVLDNASVVGGNGIRLTNYELLTLNGSQLDANDRLWTVGGGSYALGATATGGSATTDFNDSSGADGVAVDVLGGSAMGVGLWIVPGVATGGTATMNFRASSHADDADFSVGGVNATAVGNEADGEAYGGAASLAFSDGSHADGATFRIDDGGTSSSGSSANADATAVGGTVNVRFGDASHADNATFTLAGAGVSAGGGWGSSGYPYGGASGGRASAIGGTIGLSLADDSHADGATIELALGFASEFGGGGFGGNMAVGGAGGPGAAADFNASGGWGGSASAAGSSVSLTVSGNAHVNNSTVDTNLLRTFGRGGAGGPGGLAGTGGPGGGATFIGGTAGLLITDDARVDGTVFTNVAGEAVAVGGAGGNGDLRPAPSGAGGRGGGAIVTGSNVALTVAGNVALSTGTEIHNTAGNASATGGAGGHGSGGPGGNGGAASATGGGATVTFADNASAGDALIVNTGGMAGATGGAGGNGGARGIGANGGNGGEALATPGAALVEFTSSSTAGTARIENHTGPQSTATPGVGGADYSAYAVGGQGGSATYGLGTPEIRFRDSATGGSAHVTNDGGLVTIHDSAVFGSATAGGAWIDNNQSGNVTFLDSGSLGNAAIVNGDGTGAAFVDFNDASTAGTGSIVNKFQGTVSFQGISTLGSATVTNSGTVNFLWKSDAVDGGIIGQAGGSLQIAGGSLELGIHHFRLGSLSGAGEVVIAPRNSLEYGFLDRDETFSGEISGVGNLVKRGSGTLALSGANTYDGLTIHDGTVQLDNVAAAGSGRITIIDGNLRTNVNGTLSASALSWQAGSKGIVSAAAGTTVTLAGSLGFASTTLRFGTIGDTGTIVLGQSVVSWGDALFSSLIVQGGTLREGAGYPDVLSRITGNVAWTQIDAGATLDFDGTIYSTVRDLRGAGTLTNDAETDIYRGDFAGSITGAGGLRKSSANKLILSGANTYRGTTTIAGGVLQIGAGGTTGTLGTADVVDNASLVFNRSDTITYGGAISGTGSLIKAGSGVLILSGANSYTGATTVSAGTLRLSGSVASDSAVNAGATVDGTGTINGALIANGTVTPGTPSSPFGTLAVTGNAGFNAGSFLQPAIAADGRTSLLQAGSLTLDGGRVKPGVSGAGFFPLSTDYRIATGTDGITGTFAGVDESLLPAYLDSTLLYSAGEVTLRLRRNSTGFATNAGLTPNQAAAGGSLDAAIAAGKAAVFTTYAALYDTLLIAARGGTLAGQLESLSGDALTPYPLAAQRSAQRFGERLEQYTWSNSSNLWGLVAYADEQAGSDGNGPGFKARGPEFQIGFNTSLAEGTRVGLSLGYSKIDLDSSQLTGALDTWSTGLRLRQDFKGLYAAGQGTYSWHSDDSKRTVASGTAAASYNAQTWTLGGELGGVLSVGQFSVEPFASVRHAETRQDRFSETGPVTELAVAAEDYRTTSFGGGLRLANRDPAASTHFEGSLRYEHESGDSAVALDNALPGLPAFRVLGTELGEDIFSAQAGIEFHVSKTATVFAGASGSWRTNESNAEANGGLRVRF